MPGPLSHVRVLDLSRVLAGPWAGQNLADLGAEVIKIERPGAGDDSRAFGPPWVKDADGRDTKDSAYFTSANRGKKSLTLNIAHPDGQSLVRDLARKCDVLIENYKYGDLARYGLGYEDLRELNPGLIYCSVTGFGQTGPYRQRPGYDFMIQGMGGMMSVTGEPDGAPGGGPQRAGVPIADIITGMYASIAICAALAHRAETGAGQHLDLALLDSQIALLAYQNTNYFATGVPPERIGNLHPNIVPYQPFRASDGELILACGNDNLYNKFCAAAGCPELARDPRFATNGKRVENRAELTRLLAEVFKKRSTREWLELLQAAGVPNGPINDIAQVFEEPQVKARRVRIELDHAAAGRLPMVASPMRFSGTPIEYRRGPPVLGEHTVEVLRGLLGKSETELARLRAAGII
ncbi:MAG TPA: CaiB/BaiF CoA-transferase family protein [Burkholderiales bacterium]|jgi:crotonobetainyl-CoA:carnitine CoA-transferase CaiB-like acyl-CoA transferase|nr:CaiB/BaiF CoA-transferase family protein [Burkholderiales bacterium]